MFFCVESLNVDFLVKVLILFESVEFDDGVLCHCLYQ